MPKRTLAAINVAQAKDQIAAAIKELKAEKKLRHPGDALAQMDAESLPLHLTANYSASDGTHKYLTTGTLGGALDVLNAVGDLIRAESLRRNPGDFEAQSEDIGRPMHLGIAYDVADLDRATGKGAHR
ncbi:hypothetical protein QIS99_30365 [Streptomyces sp. B-S-A8]|uniref:Uncharacterized protein n=1 Tax=Streptomyces solicavernae TaxID=3043614 RepID=A0ABT6S1J5_9ACTN|nr:hypothetical protein [Streptomyces sp. B-S-A8]MDI3390465.1 hypothetical protein [Streptomyces sp. B-S-A8]